MKIFLTFLLLLSAPLLATLTDSIIPLMAQAEDSGSLPKTKYGQAQLQIMENGLQHKEGLLRVMSYNMLSNTTDHKQSEENRWSNRLPRIVELLQEADPDIICSQELYDIQVEELSRLIGDRYTFYGVGREGGNGGEVNGIFYKKSRFKALEQSAWFTTPSAAGELINTLIYVQLQDLKTEKVLCVFNTHLPFREVDLRASQASWIMDIIEPYAAQNATLFCGDLNTFPNRLDLPSLPFFDGDYIASLLTASGTLTDTANRSLLGHLGPLSTFTNEGIDPTPFKGTGTPGVFLDHIYITKNTDVLLHAVQPARVDGHFPSDHMPLIVDFIIH